MVQVISKNEPTQYIEEEVLIINPKTGKQERKLIRRPYISEEVLGEELNESIDTNTRVVGRRVVPNDHCSDDWILRGT